MVCIDPIFGAAREESSMTRRLKRACLLLGLVGCGCLDDLQDAGKVASVSAIPGDRQVTAHSGETVALALQARDPDGQGANGVDCFFAVGDASLLTFATASSGESTHRILTKRDAIENVSSDGLAVAHVSVRDVTEPTDARVWAGIGSGASLDSTADGTANQVWEFVIHIEPADGGGTGGEGGL